MSKLIQISLRLDDSDYEFIKEAAQESRMSRNTFMVQALLKGIASMMNTKVPSITKKERDAPTFNGWKA